MNSAIDEARDAGRRAVVLITAPSWCHPCRQFEPHYARSADNTDAVKFIGVDLDNNTWASVDFGVRSVPTAWLFDESGVYAREVKVPQPALPFIKDITEGIN